MPNCNPSPVRSDGVHSSSAPDVFDLGEIFYGDSRIRTNFWGFLARKARSSPDIVCPHYWYNAWEDYVQEQYNEIGHKIFVFDLKIDYFRYVLSHHSSAQYAPEWLFFFDTSTIKFIYLERRNVAAQIFSRMRAERTGEWGVFADGMTSESLQRLIYVKYPPSERIVENSIPSSLQSVNFSKKIHIDIPSFELQLQRMAQSNQFGLSCIERYNPLKLFYEEIFDIAGAFNEKMMRNLSQYLNIDLNTACLKPILKKQIEHSFINEIENRDEVVRYFSATPFAAMFRESEA